MNKVDYQVANEDKKAKSLTDRFWNAVKKSDGCWEWQRSTNKAGYGQIGTGSGKGRTINTHRLSWILHYGEIPFKMNVCHRCDNRKCVNPDHLFLGTQMDNVRDMHNKGRNARGGAPGERNGSAKLKEMDISRIRELYAAGGISQQRIADQYNCSQGIISQIILRKRWNFVS
jgi:hypothetical protein